MGRLPGGARDLRRHAAASRRRDPRDRGHPGLRPGERCRRSERPAGRRPALPGAAPSGRAERGAAGRGAADALRSGRRGARGASGRRRVPRAPGRRHLPPAPQRQPGRGRSHPAGRRVRGGGADRAAVQRAGPRGRGCRPALAARRRRAGGRSRPRRPARRRVGLPAATGGAGRPAELAPRRRTVRRVGLLAGRVRRPATRAGPAPGAAGPHRLGGRRRGCPRCAGRGHRRPSGRLRRPAGGPPPAGLGAARGGRDPAGPRRRPDRAAGQPPRRTRGARPRARPGGPRLLGRGRARLPAGRDRRDAEALVGPAGARRAGGCGVPGRRQRRQPRGRDVGPLDGHRRSRRAGPAAGGAAAAPYRQPPRVRRPRVPLPSGLRAAARGADDGTRTGARRDADHAQPQPRPGLRAHRVDRVGAGGQVRRRAR